MISTSTVPPACTVRLPATTRRTTVTDTEEQPPAWWDDQFQRTAGAIEMCLRFVWACQRQIHRFADGFGARPEIYWDYSQGIVAPVDKVRIYDLYRVDGYLVAVLANQVIGWLSKAEKELGVDAGKLQLTPEIAAQVGILRDVYEHWAEHVDSFQLNAAKDKAGGRFAKANPNLAMPGDGWRLNAKEGPFLDNLRLNDLFADLRRVEDLLLQAQRDAYASVGLTIPDGDYRPLPEWQYFSGKVKVEET
jgi:hypothetical protein